MAILNLKEALKGKGVFFSAVVWEDTDAVRIASDSYPLPVKVMSGGGSGTQYSEGDTTSPATGTLSLFRRSSDGKLYAAELDDNNVLKVNVVAGGAGGGAAQTQVRDSSNNWVDVGYYTGNLSMPVKVQNTVTVQIKEKDPISKTGDYSTAQTDTILWTPASGKKFVITDILISTDTALTVTLKDGTTVIRKYYLDANGGVVENLKTPYKSTAADNALKITTSDDGNVFISIQGYEE